MEAIGKIIRKHRCEKGLTQAELGAKLFVSKQAISKWETGKTLPDIEMVRKLCDILDVAPDEVLGSTVETARSTHKQLRIWSVIAVISVVGMLVMSVCWLDLPGWVERRTQSGVAYLSVFYDGEIISVEDYRVVGIEQRKLDHGYQLEADYGEMRGVLKLQDGQELLFGFVNTNNWHNIQLRIDIEETELGIEATQTVTFKTDGDAYRVLVTEGVTEGKQISVFREGL